MKYSVLITGGAGFIGHNTANKLVRNGHTVRVIDNLSRQVHPDPKRSLALLDPAVEFICGDVRERSHLQAALEGIDVVYHLAAETGVGQSMYEIERYADVTIQGTAVLCDCICKAEERIKKIVLSSSRAVYGEGQYWCESCSVVYPEARPLTPLKEGKWELVCPQCSGDIVTNACQEKAQCQPTSIYGLTKRVQEDMLRQVAAAYDFPVVILRYFNVFGAGQSVSNPYTGVLSIFTSLLLENKGIEIYEDGLMQRDFISINEVVNANIQALDFDAQNVLILNVGSGVPRTIVGLAESLKEKTGSSSSIKISGRYRVGDIRHCFADVSKMANYIGQSPNGTFEKGIMDLVSWVKSNSKGITLEKSIAELSSLGLTGIANDFQVN